MHTTKLKPEVDSLCQCLQSWKYLRRHIYAADGPIHMKLDALVQTDANSDSNDEWKVKLKREVDYSNMAVVSQYWNCFCAILYIFKIQ